MAPLVRVCDSLAHDLNNILGSIEGYHSLAEAGLPPGSRVRADLDGIRGAWAKAAEITGRLHCFSGRRAAPRKAGGLGTLIGRAAAAASGKGWEGISISVSAADLPEATLNEDVLGEALAALLENARDAMPGGGEILLSAGVVTLSGAGIRVPELRPGPARFLRLAVADTGEGVPAENMERLFEPFFSTRESRGLGLAVVYGAALLHGGWAEAASAPCEGSEFSIYLPLLSGNLI